MSLHLHITHCCFCIMTVEFNRPKELAKPTNFVIRLFTECVCWPLGETVIAIVPVRDGGVVRERGDF